MAREHDCRMSRGSPKIRDHGGVRLVNVNDVVGFAPARGSDRVPMDKNGKCKSGYATVHGCGDVLGTEIIHRMPCKNELVMDEPHDAAHPSVARPRHVMRYKNPHQRLQTSLSSG